MRIKAKAITELQQTMRGIEHKTMNQQQQNHRLKTDNSLSHLGA